MLWFKVFFVSLSINTEFYEEKKQKWEKENFSHTWVK